MQKEILFLIDIFLSGIIILIGVILINLVARVLKLNTWYDFINQIANQSLKQSFVSQGIINLIFLFLIYPLLLGFIVWFCVKYLALNL